VRNFLIRAEDLGTLFPAKIIALPALLSTSAEEKIETVEY